MNACERATSGIASNTTSPASRPARAATTRVRSRRRGTPRCARPALVRAAGRGRRAEGRRGRRAAHAIDAMRGPSESASRTVETKKAGWTHGSGRTRGISRQKTLVQAIAIAYNP